MKIKELADLLSADIRAGATCAESEVRTAYAGDMLSDVLSLGTQPDVLLTGLLNPQVIRTAEMLDTACVVFMRGKQPTDAMLELAEKSGICVLATPFELYAACALLARGGIEAAE